jgi:hypothetical protein
MRGAGWDSPSAFPPGLEATRSTFPAMNCWAILTHPSGMFPDYAEGARKAAVDV